MTETTDSVTRQIFEVTRGVAAPLFTERGFMDVASLFNQAQSIDQMIAAYDYAEQVCACPGPVLAALHDLRTACERVKKQKEAGIIDQNVLAFAKLQSINAAALLQDSRQ